MGRRVFKAVVVAATTGVWVGLLTPTAALANVSCGQTITASMTLTHDLNCPTGNGIVVGASNVVLDLGGYLITGAVPTDTGSGPRGVVVQQNRTGVTVRNGVVQGFDSGVDVSSGTSGTVITELTLDSNGLGVRIITGASSSRVTGNSIINTVRFSAIQMGGNGHVVESNTMTNGNSAGVFFNGNNNVVRSNRISDMGGNAITLNTFPSSPGPFLDNQVVGNQVSGASRLSTSAVSINVNNGVRTLVQGNLVNGRRITPGIFVLNSADTVVSGNTLVNNSSTGVLVRGTSTGTQVIGNQAQSNSFSGITIENGPTGTLVADNVVAGNGSNGINVSSASTTIARNTAYSNGNLGIFAVAGVTDGGGNRAFNNGNPAQCSPTIVCSS